MGIVQVIIDDTASKTITGSYVFDRDNGGTFVGGAGSVFPSTPEAGEWFWRTDEAKLYRRNSTNTAWEAATSAIAAHAASHKDGGGDQVGTATPAAAAIPKADGSGKLDSWVTADAAAATASLRKLGTGATEACAGNDSRLSNARTPTAHASSHNAGGGDALAIDSEAGTGSLRTLGTAATAACAGNDSRLSNSRTPTAHATSHKSGGSDAVKLDELAAPTDVTTLNATTGQHGLLPKLNGITTNFLRGDGTWAVPPGGSAYDPFAEANFFDDFMAAILDDQWATTTSGAGSSIALQAEQGGVVLIRAGNSAGRWSELLFWLAASVSVGRNPKMKLRAQIPTITNAHYEIELLYVDASNYVILRGDSGGNWFLQTRAGGTETVTDTGTALDAAWHTYELRGQTGQVTAYIDGVLKATNTTNVPTGLGRVSIYVAALGSGGVKDFYLDAFQFTSSRAP